MTSNLDIIANELRNQGFGVYQGVDYVKIYLKSRKVSVMEVETALMYTFEDIDFSVVSNGNSVIVKEWQKMNSQEIFKYYTEKCHNRLESFEFLSTLNASQLVALELSLYRAGYTIDMSSDIEWVQEAGVINCGDEYWDLFIDAKIEDKEKK